MMMDWNHYWNHVLDGHKETDFFHQVGKTVGGVAISEDQITLSVNQMQACLGIGNDDVVLDLCCGNGLITREIAPRCRKIVGVDFSAPLVGVARAHHCPENTRYQVGSVLALPGDLLPAGERFSRVYMHEALQYFDEGDLRCILAGLRPLTTAACPVFFGGIPDQARLWAFYDTPERKQDYLRRKAEGREAIGTWWERPTLSGVAHDAGYRCDFIEQPAGLYSAHYRFGALLTPA